MDDCRSLAIRPFVYVKRARNRTWLALIYRELVVETLNSSKLQLAAFTTDSDRRIVVVLNDLLNLINVCVFLIVRKELDVTLKWHIVILIHFPSIVGFVIHLSDFRRQLRTECQNGRWISLGLDQSKSLLVLRDGELMND